MEGGADFGSLRWRGVNLTRSATAANPTSGTAAAPTNNNEVVVCQLVRATAATTSNSAPWLPSGTLTGVTQTLAQYFQYQIQTSATTVNCNYTSVSAAFRDTQFSLINSASTGGYHGLTGVYAVANAQTNAATATAAILNTISGATAGSLTSFSISGVGWTGGNAGINFKTGSSTAPLGSLKILGNQQPHTLGDSATAINFPIAELTHGFNFEPYAVGDQGNGMWSGMFINVEGTLTAAQGCDVMANFGGVVDGSLTLQLNYQTLTGACTGLNSGICLDIERDSDSSTGAALNTSPAMTHGCAVLHRPPFGWGERRQ